MHARVVWALLGTDSEVGAHATVERGCQVMMEMRIWAVPDSP
jgi:hypothetical protein